MDFFLIRFFMQHLFYGKSVPFVSSKDALKNATLRGYFNSAQALADYAKILLHIKENLSAEMSPIIVVGASYGGMLAAWFRSKYPHSALGAVASFAPIIYFDNITPSNAYYDIVTSDFREASESCYMTIKQSWVEMDKTAARKNGLAFLSKMLKTCK
ncbi:hypothetical protein KPL70_011333 [Citrus sinensis]|uniref:Uncharacterized protein n=1 Tax=Citrus clementina TaxID=85681 RepID=V4TDY7_CITCL|nr:hypothetical protein CICLE_v10033652mg [Citrus x clementina]KAH9704121.1 hypothetical protein KPL70_011333 [Citrus sinensis]